MTNFEHILKTINPKVHKDILAWRVAIMKETGEIYECNTCEDICEKCIFSNDCLNGNGTKATREWLDKEYIEPKESEDNEKKQKKNR